jgi:hypothetical protein
MVKEWKAVWNQYKDRLQSNRKSGAEVVEYLASKYPLMELHDNKALRVVTDNVIKNSHIAEKLPEGTMPSPVTFIIENTGAGKNLYDNQDSIFMGKAIFVGIDLMSGYFCVEGSSMLWDEIYALQGLDERDIQNYYCVAEYISCLKKLGLLENVFE